MLTVISIKIKNMAIQDQETILAGINETGLLPLFYHPDFDIVKEVVAASYRGGARAFEFTNRGENAYEVFVELAKYAKASLPGMSLGIGTVYDGVTAEKYIAAGADFVLAPFTNPEVGKVCLEADVPWMPGTATLTEIFNAIQGGARVVKLFPGEVVGPAFVKAAKGPMPHVRIVVTGGVQPTKQSIDEWFGAGVFGVGMGSNLFPKDVISSGNYAWIEQKVADSIALIKAFRAGT
jgi:2-dehydro-3-deoxyphosphogluconate aldolase / (4S)-4-hydroxy-2-oxoglutarate aldolase